MATNYATCVQVKPPPETAAPIVNASAQPNSGGKPLCKSSHTAACEIVSGRDQGGADQWWIRTRKEGYSILK